MRPEVCVGQQYRRYGLGRYETVVVTSVDSTDVKYQGIDGGVYGISPIGSFLQDSVILYDPLPDAIALAETVLNSLSKKEESAPLRALAEAFLEKTRQFA